MDSRILRARRALPLVALALIFIVGPFNAAGDAGGAPASRGDVVSLREYVDIRFDAQQRAVQAALDAADRAVAKSEAASDKRFESVNEFRKTLSDQTRDFIPRTEAEQLFKTLNEKVEANTSRLNAADARGQGRFEAWGYVVGALGVGTAIFTLLYHAWPAAPRDKSR